MTTELRMRQKVVTLLSNTILEQLALRILISWSYFSCNNNYWYLRYW